MALPPRPDLGYCPAVYAQRGTIIGVEVGTE